jgi:UDP-GlcNAc:undecaprenyl-phosphate GlcNAc-1-phosphate transferase
MSSTFGEFNLAGQIFIAAIFATALFVNLSIAVTKRFGILDEPGKSVHKKHLRSTPIAGGITIALVMIAAFAIFGRHFPSTSWKIFIATIIVFLFGLVDDIKGMGAGGKILGQSLAAIYLIASGVSVSIINFGPKNVDLVINLLITFVWLLSITNAYNLIDGIDGLAISLGIVTSLFLLIGSIIAQQPEVTNLVVIVLGSFLVLLSYNLPPAKLFLGDSGAQTVGFFFAALAILYNPLTQPQSSSWFVPITFFAIPIFDVVLVFFSRVRRGLAFYKSDLNHTHHRLIRMGLSRKWAILAMSLVALGIGLLGLIALYQDPVFSNLIFVGLLIGGIFTFFFLEKYFVPNSAKNDEPISD